MMDCLEGQYGREPVMESWNENCKQALRFFLFHFNFRNSRHFASSRQETGFLVVCPDLNLVEILYC